MSSLRLVPILLSFALLAVAALPSRVCAAPPPGYSLTWHDEFNGTALDTTKWTIPTGSEYGTPVDPAYVWVSGGFLHMHTGYDAQAGKMECSYLTTYGKESFQYGYMEIRCRQASSAGQQCGWPSFSLYGDGTWLPEYDVAEYGYWNGVPGYPDVDSMDQAVHLDTTGAQNQNYSNVCYPANRSSFHTFGVLLQPDQGPIFSCDGQVTMSAPVSDNQPVIATLINTASGAPIDHPIPNLLVDYIRWYQPPVDAIRHIGGPLACSPGRSATVYVKYAAAASRFISVTLFNSEWTESYGSASTAVPTGIGRVALTLPISANTPPGSGYNYLVQIFDSNWNHLLSGAEGGIVVK